MIRRLGIDLRPGEESIAILLFLCFFLFITFQYATKSVRNSSYIDGLGAQNMPWAYLGVAVLSYPFLRIYSRFADRMARHRLMIGTSGVIALSLLSCYWLFQYTWQWIPYVLYVWISIAYVMTVSQFWSFSNHVLDPRQAKRLFGFIGAGGLLGGVAGGQVSRLVSQAVETRAVFLVAAVILIAATGLSYIVHRLHPVASETTGGAAGLAKLEEARGGFEVIRQSRQLQWIAAVMLLTVVVAVIVDQQYNWAAEQAASGLDALTGFFGNIYSVMGISAFLFQIVFTARIHRTLGVGTAMRILPSTMALGTGALFISALFFPPAYLVAAAVTLKVGENGLRYSLDQATRELLFLPVPSKARIKAKAYIDVFIQRGAKGVAAILLLPFAFGLMNAVQIGWISLALIGVWFAVIVAAHREYVWSFRESMKSRSVDTEIPINLSDVTTLELLIQSMGSPDSRQVLHSLEILSSNGKGHLVPPLLLYHDNPEVRRKTLSVLADVNRQDAAGLVERLLRDDDPDIRAEAIRVLAGLQSQHVCDLMLPRLNEVDPGIRAAAVACLANHGDPEMVGRSEKVLADLLSDESPEIRAEAAKALGAIREPRFQERLVQLLYDSDPKVVCQAIAAVRRRIARDGYNPIYVSTLTSLLQKRRIKHDAREALVAFGAQAVPALTHFMNDPKEYLWIRRALPKTIARISTIEATQALMDCLGQPADRFLRKKLIEAIGSLPSEMQDAIDHTRIHQEIAAEAQRYLQALVELESLGLARKARMDGPLVQWNRDTIEPDLVDRLLAEHLEDHFNNLFGLLAIIHTPRHVRAAHCSLSSGSTTLRTSALEYLDNTLTGDTKRNTFAVIDDTPLEEKLQRARRLFGVSAYGRIQTLAEKLSLRDGDAEAHLITTAALYTVYTDRIASLYPKVKELAAGIAHPLVNETADWVLRKLGPEIDPFPDGNSTLRPGLGT